MRAIVLSLALIVGTASQAAPVAGAPDRVAPEDTGDDAPDDAPGSDDAPDSDDPNADDGPDSSDEPEADEPEGPLAIPGPARDAKKTTPAGPTRPGAKGATPAGPAAAKPKVTPQGPPPPPPPIEERERPIVHVDAGYRVVWIGNEYLPTHRSPRGEKSRPHLIHANAGMMFDKNVYAGLSFETTLNPAAGAFPLVAEARVGWWDNAFGEPEMRGPFQTMPGVAITYVGWRWVHDYYRGQGGEWAFTGDSAGLVLGYTRAAPFGRLTVVTDSQFSLYLVGWKERADFPLGLLNQRLSIGFDPVFIDARFKSDPGTGTELSIGVSMQSMF